jgi:hypothetical protein
MQPGGSTYTAGLNLYVRNLELLEFGPKNVAGNGTHPEIMLYDLSKQSTGEKDKNLSISPDPESNGGSAAEPDRHSQIGQMHTMCDRAVLELICNR